MEYCRVQDVAAVDSGPAFKSSHFGDRGDGIPLLRGDNIEPGALRWTRTKTWPDGLLAGYEHLFVESGDLVLGMDRPVVAAGLKLAPVRPVDLPALLVQRVARIRPKEIDGRYLYHWLKSDSFAQHLLGSATGTQLPHVTLASIRNFQVPRFGYREERRIVELLEDHVSRLDAANNYLDVGLRKLDALEQLALANCREGNPQSLADVTAIQGGIQKQQKRAPENNAFPFLRVANVTARGLDLTEVHEIELFDGELDKLRLQHGDLLVVEGNGSASQIGRAALWDGSIKDCVHQNHLIRVRPLDGLLPAYLEAVWNSPQNRATLTDVASSSSGLHTLSVTKLKALPIPLPSVERQQELVASLDVVREARMRLSHEIAAARAHSNHLRRSILAAAFSGRLSGTASDPVADLVCTEGVAVKDERIEAPCSTT